MSNWKIIVPEAGRNRVKNPSAELPGNFGLLTTSPSTSISPSPSLSPSASASISPSASRSPSASASISPSGSASRSPSASASPSGSASPSSSVSVSPSASAGVAGVTRTTQAARFGDYAYAIKPTEAYQGFTLTLETLANAIHYVTLYCTAVQTTMEVSLDGNAFHPMTVLNGGPGATWKRVGAQIPAAQASGSTTLYIRNSVVSGVLIDGIQVEQASYPTTYIDGDQGPLYRWIGLRHGSASTRDPQERGGGRERDLYDDYGLQVTDATRRIGMPPLQHNLQGQALQPGASYQSTKVLPREIALGFLYEGEGATEALAWAAVHSKRQDLIDLLKPDAVRGAQPVVIGYAGANPDRKLYASFRYSSGLEFGEFLGYSETPTVRLFAPDPFWYEDDRGTAALDFQDSMAAAFGLQRVDGQWLALGSGFNNAINVIVADRNLGRVYFGGTFTTANGVTVNRICYWNGSTFVAMDGGLNDGTVSALALAPNGDLWVGGTFTSVGTATATADGLARWNVSAGTWTAINVTVTSFVGINALTIDHSGSLYIGGEFQNWNAIANADRIAKFDGVTWTALGTGMDDIVNGLWAGSDGNIYAGGIFTTGNSVTLNGIGYWNGTTFVAMGSGYSTGFISDFIEDAEGNLYAAGSFESMNGVSGHNYLARWNGIVWNILGSGINGAARSLAYIDGNLIAGGQFTIAGGLVLADRVAGWNGSTWYHLDVDLSGTPSVSALGAWGENLYLGFSSSVTATVAGFTTVTPSATTAVFPDVTIIGPSSGTATLQALDNQSTGERLYFNLTINTLETILIDFAPGNKVVASLWSARPGHITPSVPLHNREAAFLARIVERGAGLIIDQPLPGSDFAAWHLLPGANRISALISGTITGVVMLMHWTPKHWSADGPA